LPSDETGKENREMGKRPRAKYTLEYKLEALRLIGAGQSVAVVAATLGVADQTLHNWLKAQREGRLGGPGSKPVSPEQMELARLRAELARTKMELDIVKKAAAYFAKESL
jgi:transposase